MEQDFYTHVQFNYLDNDRTQEIVTGLKTHDGYDVHYPDYRLLGAYGDVERNVYFVRAYLEERQLARDRVEQLREKYRAIYPYVRNISEYILLVQGRQAHILADVSSYQDGVSIHLLEIRTKDFTPEEMPQLRRITVKAMDFVHNSESVPEYSYADAGAWMTCEEDGT